MVEISKKEWDSITSDYKGEWQDYYNDHPEWIGRKVVMSGCICKNPNELGKLLIEGVDFIIGKGKIIEEVKVYIDCLNEDHKGDFVKCVDCGELMLMQIGGTACGECESENLQWYDENKPEWTIEELQSAGFIIIEKINTSPFKALNQCI